MPIISRIGAAAARGFGLFGKIAAIKDAYFNYVTLLLPGNGTNGAQNNTFLDSSSNAFTITRNGNTTQGNFSPFSQTGWSNNFASGNYLSAASNAAFAPGTGDFTVEAWINHTSAYTTYNYILGVAVTGGLVFYVLGGVLVVRAYNVGDQLTSTYSPPLNQWTHVAAVRSGTTLTIYANGTAVASTTNSYNFAQGAAYVANDSGNLAPWYGYISNLRMVKGTAVYTGNFTPPTAPLTAITNTSLLTCQSNRFIDNSSNAFALTVTGSPSVQAFSPFAPTAAWSASTNGGSGYFDGSGDYLVLPSSSNLAFGTGDFSVEGWVYLTSLGSNANIYSNATANDTEFAFTYLTTGVIRFSGWNTVFVASGSGAVTTNQWLHVVACRSGTTGSIFVNGSRVATATVTNNFSGTTAFGVGASGAGASPITGYIGSFRVLKGSSAYDATQTTLTVPTAPLTAITNTQLLLSATNGGIVDATAKNDLETVGNAQISTTQSKFGGSSMKFNGTTDYLVSPSSPLLALGTGDLTVEFWFYASSVGTNQRIVQNTNGGFDATSYILRINNSSKLEVAFAYPDVSASSTTTIANNTWYHVALVRYGTSVKVYLNGIQEISGTSSGNMSRSVVYVGGYYTVSGEYFNGYVDDVRITKGIARYTSNFTPPTSAFLLQ